MKALNELLCMECAEDFVVHGGLCVLPIALNCAEFWTYDTSSCVRCNDGFCVSTAITACKRYAAVDACAVCERGWVLAASHNGPAWCAQVEIADSNCLEARFSRGASLTAGCDRCDKGGVTVPLDVPVQFCQTQRMDVDCEEVGQRPSATAGSRFVRSAVKGSFSIGRERGVCCSPRR